MTKRSAWLTPIMPPSNPRLRLICVPYAGGSAAIYRKWTAHLSPDIELCAVELPGHGARIREQPMTRLDQLVDELAAAIQPLDDLPFALFGHSLGAAIAFELTRLLECQPAPRPIHLFLSGQKAPHLPPSRPPIHGYNDAEFLRELRRFDGTPDELFASPELVDLFLPILRADFELLETYEFVDTGPIPCGMSVLGGRDDPEVDVSELMQWRRYAAADFQVRDYPGNHFFPWAYPDDVVTDLDEDLRRI